MVDSIMESNILDEKNVDKTIRISIIYDRPTKTLKKFDEDEKLQNILQKIINKIPAQIQDVYEKLFCAISSISFFQVMKLICMPRKTMKIKIKDIWDVVIDQSMKMKRKSISLGKYVNAILNMNNVLQEAKHFLLQKIPNSIYFQNERGVKHKPQNTLLKSQANIHSSRSHCCTPIIYFFISTIQDLTNVLFIYLISSFLITKTTQIL